MIVKNNVVGQFPVGRFVQKLQSNFILRQIPSWMEVTGTPDYVDNGIDVNGSIALPAISMGNVEQVSIEVGNIHWSALPTNPYIKLVNGDKFIGIVGNKLIYNDGNSNVINDQMGKLDDNVIWSWCSGVGATQYDNKNTDYHLGSKNIGIVIQPQYGYIHVLYNGDAVHSRKFSEFMINNSPLNIDFSGDWHWEIGSGGQEVHVSGIDIEIQQNI